jgi:hypothetical protein
VGGRKAQYILLSLDGRGWVRVVKKLNYLLPFIPLSLILSRQGRGNKKQGKPTIIYLAIKTQIGKRGSIFFQQTKWAPASKIVLL